jgi:hypothetical protein
VHETAICLDPPEAFPDGREKFVSPSEKELFRTKILIKLTR